MKKAFVLLPLLLPLAGCNLGMRIVDGEGEIVEATFELGAIDSVSLRHLLGSSGTETIPLPVSFFPGDEAKAVLKTHESLLKEFTHAENGASFSFEGKKNCAYRTKEFSLCFYGVSPKKLVGESVKIYDEGILGALEDVSLGNVGILFAKSIESESMSLSVHAASSFRADSIKTGSVEARIGEASTFYVDSLVSPVSTFAVSAASKAEMGGEGEKLTLEVSSASSFRGKDFILSEAKANISSASSAEIAAKSASGTVKDASSLVLYGSSSDSFSVDDSSSLSKKY